MLTDLNRYTWEEIERMDPDEVIYVPPVSALEQHGRHLALGADVGIETPLSLEIHAGEMETSILEYSMPHMVPGGCSGIRPRFS